MGKLNKIGDIPTRIEEKAKRLGFNTVENVGDYNGTALFSVYSVGTSGFVVPCGLPTIVYESNGVVKTHIGFIEELNI